MPSSNMGDTNLGCHELGRAAECASCRPVPHVLLAETIVGNLDVPVQRQQNIVELEITIDDAVFVEVLERQAHLSGVEPEQLAKSRYQAGEAY